MKNYKKFMVLLFFCLPLFAKEPSAFEAGNLESPNPYGLTTTEKYILQNKKNIESVKKQSAINSSKIDQLEEKVEGLRSVVEGIDNNLNEIKIKINTILEEKNKDKEEVDKKISLLKEDLNKTISLQQENFEQIKKVLNELTTLIDSINSTYVNKNEFKNEIEKVYSYIDRKFLEIKKERQKQKIASKSGATLFKEAQKFYKKKDYDKAKEYFLASIKKHYKPATSNFYIGEICYYQKDYSCAIEHYKNSANLYSKASYMPTLLLHTAISLERIGQKREAKIFYENLIKKYPKSKAAKIAKKNIKKL
ncbi:tetratricopeptide repeat protein [Nitrosophilus kaiyonis]|uniref:tetratricopeptide repeat protein n=1 Tax=Nitrosophilus kaiyonis TaxID=2930200 RepID=UPI00249165B6|nr:tetratricopeptide repeat protein [Nitrosophilus kaiyonis]